MIMRKFTLLVLFLAVVAGTGAIAAPAVQTESRGRQTSDGLTVYIGVMPAEVLKGHPVHGGTPAASNEYHLVVAIFDAVTGARITDVTVTATVFGPGNTELYGQRHLRPWGSRPITESLPRTPLERMEIAQTVTYGEFFVLQNAATYTFRLTITRPDKTRPTVMDFVYIHRV